MDLDVECSRQCRGVRYMIRGCGVRQVFGRLGRKGGNQEWGELYRRGGQRSRLLDEALDVANELHTYCMYRRVSLTVSECHISLSCDTLLY